MKRIFAIVCLLAITCQVQAAILIESSNGVLVSGPTVMAAACAQTQPIHVTSVLSAIQSNISSAGGATCNAPVNIHPGGGLSNTTTFRGDITVLGGGKGVLPSAIGNPPATSTYRVDTQDTGTDRNFGFTSQITSGTDIPLFGSLSPQHDVVAGYFAGYQGAHSAAFTTVLNPLLMLQPSDTGTINTSGTSVTRVGGPNFRSDWLNGQILINGVIYKIASVTSSNSLTLTASAGTQTGVSYSGAGGNVVEVDLNNNDLDASNGSQFTANGVTVACAGTKKCRTGINVLGGGSTAWVNGFLISGFSDYGFFGVAPTTTSAIGFDISNGTSSASYLRAGQGLYVYPSGSNSAVTLQPGTDVPLSPIAQGNNASGVRQWYINQTGGTTTHPIYSTPTYSASIAIDPTTSKIFQISATNGNAFTIQNPTTFVAGDQITITIYNASGGALGAVTWGSAGGYALSAWTQPANTTHRTITFYCTGAAWEEMSRTTVDVPN